MDRRLRPDRPVTSYFAQPCILPGARAPWYPGFGAGSRVVRGDLGANTTLDLAVTPIPALGDNSRVFFVQAVHVSTTEGVVTGAPRPRIVVPPR